MNKNEQLDKIIDELTEYATKSIVIGFVMASIVPFNSPAVAIWLSIGSGLFGFIALVCFVMIGYSYVKYTDKD